MSSLNRVELRARRSRPPIALLPRALPSLLSRISLVSSRAPLAAGEGAADRRGSAEFPGGRGGPAETRRVHGRPLPLGHSTESLAQVGRSQHVPHQTLRGSASHRAQGQGAGPARCETVFQAHT